VDEAALKAWALADPKVRELLGGKEPRKVIVVPKKLVNIVVGLTMRICDFLRLPSVCNVILSQLGGGHGGHRD